MPVELEAANIIIGIASGAASALATMRVLEKRIKESTDKITEIEKAMAKKVGTETCAECKRATESELARGTKHFDDLFESQKENSKTLAAMSTNLSVAMERLEKLSKDFSSITRIEMRSS